MPQLAQGRLGVALLSALFLALILIAGYSWIQLGQLGEDTADQRYIDEARALASTIGALEADSDSSATDLAVAVRVLQGYATATGAYVSLHDAEGAIIFASGETGPPEQEAGAQEIVAARGAGGIGIARRLNTTFGTESAWFAYALPDRSGVVRIAVPLSDVSNVATPYRQLLLSTSAAAAVIIIFLLLLSGKRNTAPLRRLATMLRDGRSPDAEDFAQATAEVRDIALLIGRRTQGERDISSVVEAQQTRLISILENLNVGVIVIAEDEHVLLANAAAAQLFGSNRRIDETTTLIGLVRDYEAVEIARRALQESISATGEITQGVEPVRTVRLIASPYQEGMERRVLLAAYDVSAERRAQRLRHEFLANASHEIRTPLAGIQATLETLDLGAIDDPHAARPFVSSALVEVQRLGTFVESLLDLSRMEMGWTRLALRPIDPAEAINHAVGTMAAMSARADIALVVDIRQQLSQITADPDRLHQALVNLVHNAIKFTPAGGRVTVSADNGSDSVWIHVADTGSGISPEEMPLLMERVGQGDLRGMHGSGLGLAIVRQIVEAHQGEVQVESNLGRGSTFSLRLPSADQ